MVSLSPEHDSRFRSTVRTYIWNRNREPPRFQIPRFQLYARSGTESGIPIALPEARPTDLLVEEKSLRASGRYQAASANNSPLHFFGAVAQLTQAVTVELKRLVSLGVKRNRYPPAVRQDAALRSLLGSIRRIFTRFFDPATGALCRHASRESHRQSIPFASSYLRNPFFQNSSNTPVFRPAEPAPT